MPDIDRGGNRISYEQKRKITLREIQKFFMEIWGSSEATKMEILLFMKKDTAVLEVLTKSLEHVPCFR